MNEEEFEFQVKLSKVFGKIYEPLFFDKNHIFETYHIKEHDNITIFFRLKLMKCSYKLYLNVKEFENEYKKGKNVLGKALTPEKTIRGNINSVNHAETKVRNYIKNRFK